MRLTDVLNSLIPDNKAAGWDPVGIQIGDPATEVGSISVCHEVSEEVVDRLVDDPPDLLITYHPLLFHPTTALIAGSSPGGRALRLARAGINLAVVHTAFDVIPGGTADALAGAVGIIDAGGMGPLEGSGGVKIVTFVPSAQVDGVAAAMAAAGAGSIGRYDGCSYRTDGVGTFVPSSEADPVVGEGGTMHLEPETRLEMYAPATRADAVAGALVAAHPYEEPAYDIFAARSNEGFIGRWGPLAEPVSLAELVQTVEMNLPSGIARVAGERQDPVRTVGVVPGSGGGFISAAAAVGADVLITGDVSHHQAVAALDRGVAVIDAGHVPTERPGMRSLYAAVAALGVETRDLTGLKTNPWGR
jgi:dinuclear metal center YbgI/SA1388 family protein